MENENDEDGKKKVERKKRKVGKRMMKDELPSRAVYQG